MRTAQPSQPFGIARPFALCAAIALPSPALAASLDADVVLARATVPDEQLEPMRGGLDLGTMIARFAIERIVRVDGEIVARTQLLVDRLDSVAQRQMPDARLIGNLANLVQIGEGNRASTAPQSATQSSQTQPPVSSGTVSTPNVANGLTTEWGTALAQAMALANGDESNRPAPVNVGAVPTGSAASGATNAAPAAAAAQGTGSAVGATGAAATGAGTTAAGATGAGATTTGATPGTAAGIPVVAPVSLPTISITIPLGSGSIVVSGIPDAPALATSIQNSVQAARIETETRIDASLSSLSALRSLNFADALRQQAVEAARR